MSKHPKYRYTPTAKERKEKNRAISPKDKSKQDDSELAPDTDEASVDSTVVSRKKPKAIIIALLVLGLVAIIATMAIVIPIATTPRFPVDNPVARVEIVINGRRENLDIMLLPDDAPATVSNFIFLARYGFFDGTIISDVGGPQQLGGHGFFRFGGYESPNSSRRFRDTNENFYDRFPLFRDNREENKIGWELRTENQTAFLTQFNVSMLTGWGHSTLIQVAAHSNPHSGVVTNDPNTQQRTRLTPGNVFGTVLGQSSRELAQRIANQARNTDFDANISHTYFNEPIQTITIRRVRIFQMGEWRMTAERFQNEVIDNSARTFENWRERP